MHRHPEAAFVVLACVLSWSWWIPMGMVGAGSRPGQGWPTHLPGLLGPALAAVLVTAVVDGRRGLRDLAARVTRWRVGPRWWLLVAGTAALAGLGALVPAVAGRPVPPLPAFATYSGIAAWGVLPVTLIALIVNGFGEETGWRGLLAERLLQRHGLPPTALLVAIAWGAWHAPLFWVLPSFGALGLGGAAGWAVGLTAGSVVLTFLYRGSGRSILLVAAWHVAFNFASATEATAGVAAATASTLVMVAAVMLLVLERKRPRDSTGSRRSRTGGSRRPPFTTPATGAFDH